MKDLPSFKGPEPDPRLEEPAITVSGQAARHEYIHPNNDFVQSGDLYRKVMTENDRANLIGNIVSHLGNTQRAHHGKHRGAPSLFTKEVAPPFTFLFL